MDVKVCSTAVRFDGPSTAVKDWLLDGLIVPGLLISARVQAAVFLAWPLASQSFDELGNFNSRRPSPYYKYTLRCRRNVKLHERRLQAKFI